MEKIKDAILDAIFPRFCLNCDKEGRYLCLRCALSMEEVPLICPHCLTAQKNGKTHSDCYSREKIDGLVSFWEYDGLAKKAVYQMKENSLIDIPREMVEVAFLLMDNDKSRFSSFLHFLYSEGVVVIPVPINRGRERERGFNQSEVIAKRVSKLTGATFSKLLLKKKENREQKDLGKKERFVNVKDVFFCNDKLPVPCRAIVVDDVWTSGATMREAVNTVKKAGVEEVWGLTLTRVS